MLARETHVHDCDYAFMGALAKLAKMLMHAFATITWRIYSPISLSACEPTLYKNIHAPNAKISQTFLCIVL